MSAIPKPVKLPKTKSISSTNHGSKEHEALLNQVWENLDAVIANIFPITEEELASMKSNAINIHLENKKKDIKKLNTVLQNVTAEQKIKIETAIYNTQSYIDNFKAPILKYSYPSIRQKKYQCELNNERNVVVGYVDIHASVHVLNSLYIGTRYENFLIDSFDELEEQTSYSAQEIDRMCKDFSVKEPEWGVETQLEDVYIDVRHDELTLAELTRESLVMKSYIEDGHLAIVFSSINSPILKDALSGHGIYCVDIKKVLNT